MIAQVHAGMWRRNGFALLNQLYFYHNVKCRAEMLDRDIVMLQVCFTNYIPLRTPSGVRFLARVGISVLGVCKWWSMVTSAHNTFQLRAVSVKEILSCRCIDPILDDQ